MTVDRKYFLRHRLVKLRETENSHDKIKNTDALINLINDQSDYSNEAFSFTNKDNFTTISIDDFNRFAQTYDFNYFLKTLQKDIKQTQKAYELFLILEKSVSVFYRFLKELKNCMLVFDKNQPELRNTWSGKPEEMLLVNHLNNRKPIALPIIDGQNNLVYATIDQVPVKMQFKSTKNSDQLLSNVTTGDIFLAENIFTQNPDDYAIIDLKSSEFVSILNDTENSQYSNQKNQSIKNKTFYVIIDYQSPSKYYVIKKTDYIKITEELKKVYYILATTFEVRKRNAKSSSLRKITSEGWKFPPSLFYPLDAFLYEQQVYKPIESIDKNYLNQELKYIIKSDEAEQDPQESQNSSNQEQHDIFYASGEVYRNYNLIVYSVVKELIQEISDLFRKHNDALDDETISKITTVIKSFATQSSTGSEKIKQILQLLEQLLDIILSAST